MEPVLLQCFRQRIVDNLPHRLRTRLMCDHFSGRFNGNDIRAIAAGDKELQATLSLMQALAEYATSPGVQGQLYWSLHN